MKSKPSWRFFLSWLIACTVLDIALDALLHGHFAWSQLPNDLGGAILGAAIAFLSGDQVHIPVWADKFYLGWLFRSLAEPKRYIPRYWDARKLLSLMIRYGSSLPAGVDLPSIPSTPSTSQ